jgi:uncharacterized repeat protein (TIGR01451 family)
MKRIYPSALAAAGLAFATSTVGQTSGVTELISSSSAGVEGDQDSELPAVSADGRFVAFVSFSDNLVPGDTNLAADVFVRDRVLGTTERISVSSHGKQADGNSGLLDLMGGPSISRDGRFVAFSSEATNLVHGDSNGTADVFVRDRLLGTTERVSVATGGGQANGGGTDPAISADGRFVAFESFADDIVPDANFTGDIFVHDRQTGTTERISQAPDGSDANSESFTSFLSADGPSRYFRRSPRTSGRRLRQRRRGRVPVRPPDGHDERHHQQPSGLGRHQHGRPEDQRRRPLLTFTTQDVTFIDPDTNGFVEDSFLVDRVSGQYELTSVNDAGQQGDDTTFAGPVSDDGRFVVLVSRANNFGGGGNFLENVFLRDRVLGTTRIASVATDGTESDFPCLQPVMTPDALVIAFASSSSTFVPENQTFFASDVFVRDGRPPADLAVTQTDSPDPVVARAQVTYTVTVHNGGSGPADGVSLVDQLPDATFLSATTSQGSSVFDRRAGRLTCSLGSLAAGSSATVTIVVSPPRAGTVTNAASVRSNELDPNSADNSSTETTTVLPR